MALEPIQPLAASATRLETEGAETLARLATGASAEATVVAALRNGGVRLALLESLFEGAPHTRSRSTIDPGRIATATPTPPPIDEGPATVRGGRLSSVPAIETPASGLTPQREPRPVPTPSLPTPAAPPPTQRSANLPAAGNLAAPMPPDPATGEAAAPSPASRGPMAPRQIFVDLPVAAGLKVGDTVRLTVVDTTPHLSLRVDPTPAARSTPPQSVLPPQSLQGAAPLQTARPSLQPENAVERSIQTPTGAVPTPQAARASAAAPLLGTSPMLPQGMPPTDAGTTQRPLAVFFGAPTTAPLLSTAAPEAVHDSVTLSAAATGAMATAETDAPAPQSSPRPTLSNAAREALSQLLPRAAAGQASLAPLLADAAALLRSPAGADLPKPLAEALARLVEDAPLDPQTLDAASLRRAVQDAGPFLEAKVASLASAPSIGLTTASMAQATLSGDLKALLFVLRAALQTFAGAPVEGSSPPADRPPPPRRGAPPVGQRGIEPLLPDDPQPRQAARHLAGEVEAVLDRIRLQQAAALPEETRPSTQTATGTPDRLVEIPLRLPGETPVMALSVGPDGRPVRPGEDRGWRMRLSLDFADVGRIDGLVSVRGRRTSITLHATDSNTRALLEHHLPELRDALLLADLDVEVIDLRDHPIPAGEPVRAGSFLDRRS